MEKKQNVFIRLLGYMKDHVKSFILAMVLMLVVTGVDLYKPILIGNAIDMYIEAYDKPYGLKADVVNSEGLPIDKVQIVPLGEEKSKSVKVKSKQGVRSLMSYV